MLGLRNFKTATQLFCIITALLAVAPTHAQEITCMEQLEDIKANPSSAANQIYLVCTSQGFNNLGDMDRCLDVEGNNFMSLYFNNNFNNIVSAPYVLCLPSQCTAAWAAQNLNYISQIMEKIAQQFPDSTLFQATEVYDIVGDSNSVSVGTMITIVSFVLLVIVLVAASIVSYRFESNKERIIKKRHLLNLRFISGQGDNSARQSMVVPQDTTLTRAAKAASILDNFLKLFSYQSQGHLDFSFINGTRVFLVLWIILANSALIRFFTIKNVADSTRIQESSGYTTIMASAQMAIDTLLFISGFLLAALTLERFQNRRRVGGKDLAVFIFHRFLRLYPAFIACILLYWQIIQFTGIAPMWNQFLNQSSACDSRVWANIFLIDNLATNGTTTGCMPWGWVVSTEFQFFIVGLLMLYVYFQNHKFGLGLICLLLIGSIAATIVISSSSNYLAGNFILSNPDTFYNDFFIKPWIRICTYLIGMLAGILYNNFKNGHSGIVQFADKVLNNNILRRGMYLLGIALISAVVWSLVPAQHDSSNFSQAGHSIYLAFGRIGFVLGYFLLVLPCLFGKRNLLKTALGARFWNPLSKMSFCMFLCHQWVIERSQYNIKSTRYYDNMYAFYLGIADIAITIPAAAILTLIIEIPIVKLEKAFLVPNKLLKGSHFEEEHEDFEAIEIKKQMMEQQ